MDEQLEFLKLVVSRLESAGIPYMLTGSMAMAVYALPRMTRDLDLVIECEQGDVARIMQLFVTDCYIDEQSVRTAIKDRAMFNIIHNEWIIKADFIVLKDDEYHRTEFRRRGGRRGLVRLRPGPSEGTSVAEEACDCGKGGHHNIQGDGGNEQEDLARRRDGRIPYRS